METNRKPYDNYATPPEAYLPVLEKIDWSRINSVLDPAAGDDRILNDIRTRYAKANTDFAWAEIRRGVDYFKLEGKYDLIITNPPFSQALAFVSKALTEGKNVCLLLRLNFLGSQKRKSFWAEHAPTRLFVLSKRPSFTGGGTDSTEYAWFCWGDCFKESSGIHVL